MAELLFEILSEEIPARMQVRAGADLSKAMIAGLKKAGLSVDNGRIFTGPRRLTFVADVPLRSPDVSEERKGPRVGSPERALEGFMKAAGLSDISEAEIRTDPKKGDFYVAVMESAGRETSEILAELIPDIMGSFPWPKSMKSAASNFRWVRPLRGMIVLLDGAVVPVEVGGIASGQTTLGHRRHGPGPFTISSFKGYQNMLEGEGHVRLSHEDRKAVILEQASKLCAEAGLELVEDEGLLNEVAGLTEWPVVLLGDMDPEFLNLPDEVIRLTLKSHQKTFTVRDPKTGKLAAHFVIVANQTAPDGGAAIKAGNGKVISARLSDAVFFQTEDRKKKLLDYYDQLDTVVFHKKLGTVRDKAERVAALARELAPKVGADPDKAALAAKLSKCDLVTQTVIEATSLQGQIGRLMYEAEGGDASIAIAIEDHYKPQGPSDSVPTDPVAIAVALADKLDTLVGFWAIDEKPTGSKDPFALRRAAIGVVRIVLENVVRLKLGTFLVRAILPYVILHSDDEIEELSNNIVNVNKMLEEITTEDTRRKVIENQLEKDAKNTLEKLENSQPKLINLVGFISERLEGYLKSHNVEFDIIRAVSGKGGDDLLDISNRVKALQSFLDTDDGADLLAGYKRAANILKAEAKKGDPPKGAPSRPDSAEGAALFTALQTAQPQIESMLATEDYAAAMSALAQLRGPIDAFFTQVQIISDDIAVKDNNLRLLSLIRDTARQIADFEALQG